MLTDNSFMPQLFLFTTYRTAPKSELLSSVGYEKKYDKTELKTSDKTDFREGWRVWKTNSVVMNYFCM